MHFCVTIERFSSWGKTCLNFLILFCNSWNFKGIPEAQVIKY